LRLGTWAGERDVTARRSQAQHSRQERKQRGLSLSCVLVFVSRAA
jgi:hypothetical protein